MNSFTARLQHFSNQCGSGALTFGARNPYDVFALALLEENIKNSSSFCPKILIVTINFLEVKISCWLVDNFVVGFKTFQVAQIFYLPGNSYLCISRQKVDLDMVRLWWKIILRRLVNYQIIMAGAKIFEGALAFQTPADNRNPHTWPPLEKFIIILLFAVLSRLTFDRW